MIITYAPEISCAQRAYISIKLIFFNLQLAQAVGNVSFLPELP